MSKTVAIPMKKKGHPSKCPDIQTLADLYADHTAAEIATMYGVGISTVTSWISKARNQKRGEK